VIILKINLDRHTMELVKLEQERERLSKLLKELENENNSISQVLIEARMRIE